MTNGVSLATGAIAPGELLVIFGANLSPSTVNNCYSSAQSVFPTTCNTTTVQINGVASPLIYVSPGQVNLYAPFELSGNSAALTVSTTGGGSSSPFSLKLASASPAISAFTNTSGMTISATNPSSPGSAVLGYATGLGITNPQTPDGAVAPSNPLAHTAATIGVYVGGVPALVSFAVLAPTLVSTYEIAFTVPAGLLGNQPVVFTADGIASPPVTLQLPSGTPPALSVTTGSNLGTFPLGEVQLGLGATGGTGSYSWSVASGSNLPPGLALRPDLPSYITPSAPEGLIGVATTAGAYSFTLSVASGTSSASPAFTMKITPLTLMDGPNLPDGFVGVPYYGNGYQLTATKNGVADVISCTANSSNGISLSAACLITGTPAAAGAQNIPVTFTDGTDTVTKDLTLSISAVRITTSPLLPNAPLNAPYSQVLAAAGGTGPYTYSLSGTLPAGLALNNSVIAGTPTAGEGKYNFGVTVSDSASHAYTLNMAIDVTGSPEALPQIAQYGDLGDCSIGSGCSRAIGVSGGGTAPFTWTVSGLPPGMGFRSGAGKTLAYVSPGDLELWGTPTALGSYAVTVIVTDANKSATTQFFPLTVSPLLVDNCLAAAGCSAMPNGTLGTAYSSPFRIVGGVSPYAAALAPSRNVPNGLPWLLWASPTAVTGIPQEGGQFNPLFAFSDSAMSANTLTVSQSELISGASGTSTTVNYYPTQYAPLGQAYSLQLAACCATSYVWIQPSGTLPPGLSLSSAGLIGGMANSAGTYTMLVQATQTGNTGNYGTRALTVVETPISITTSSTLPVATEGVSYSQSIAASGATGSVTWSLAPGDLLPPGLSLNGLSGVISGTPSTTGGYAFSVLATDFAGHVGQQSFTSSVYTACDVNQGGTTTLADLQEMVNEALGKAKAVHDLNHDEVVNVVDIEISANAVLGLGCSAS
ncbi:MAG TPA: putative Ig domain-containing protein [Bryobacteraceae bacterium]|nr:putative Ig domain-containing protein [Bryobacteraceae bacterium]